ncbi:MAG: hypothetical protein ABL898_15525 [Hyphomicrobiaceae bacterium]
MRSLLRADTGFACNHIASIKFNRFSAHAAVVAATLLTTLTSAAAADPAKRFTDAAMIEQARSAARGEAKEESPIINIGRSPAEQRALEEQRDAELATLIERLKQTQAAAKAKKSTPTDTARAPIQMPWSTEVSKAPTTDYAPEQRSALGSRPHENYDTRDSAETRGRATILLVMNPQAQGRRLRAPEPILCVEYGCYVSTGAQAPSTFLSFRQATGPFGRLGRGAGACASTETCVFRGIDLGHSGSTPVQPVDLRFARPDRKMLRDIVADESCRMISGRLSCSRPVRTEDYTMWVVPERLASTIGPDALDDAVVTKLQTATSADLPWLAR